MLNSKDGPKNKTTLKFDTYLLIKLKILKIKMQLIFKFIK